MNKVFPWMVVGASVLMTACASIENDGYDFKDVTCPLVAVPVEWK